MSTERLRDPMKLGEIRALIEAATPGPWHGEGYDDDTVYNFRDNAVARVFSTYDLKFITAARTLMPLLLDVAEAAQKSCEDDYECLERVRRTLAALEAADV